MAARLINPDDEVLIIDEADDVLNVEAGIFGPSPGGLKKSMINDFLDTVSARMIFITNSTWRIPDSVLRRFTLHIGFEDFTQGQRLKLWDSMCVGDTPFTGKERQILASRYKANPARIRQIVDVCSSMGTRSSRNADHPTSAEPLAIAQDMLARSDEIMYRLPRNQENRRKTYDPSLLNIGMQTAELLAMLDRWKSSFQENQRGINLLFYGLPGTGKTAFAAYLSDYLGFYPTVKRSSDLLNAYVGQTELNIRNAFKDAEGSILIIDEADSLLSERQNARYSWERSMTNELLTSMESFKGMFIASTNFKSILDNASMRRFTCKIEFMSTAPEQRPLLMARYFPELAWESTELEDLVRLDQLTPGDAAVVANRLRLNVSITPEDVIASLREEIGMRGNVPRRIGF